MPERFAVEVTADDDWESIAELGGFPGIPVVLIEALVGAITNAAYIRYQPLRPETGEVGIQISAGAGAGFGPVQPVSGYPLQQIWVRNVSAGSDATIVATGVTA
jgi:hypothetical protein